MPKMGKPLIYDPTPIIMSGIERALRAAGKIKSGCRKNFAENIKPAFKLALRIKDEQNAVMRYRWYNLPGQITGELIERMLYYRGQLAFAYLEDVVADGETLFPGRFVMLPYTLIGDTENPTALDEYARFKTIRLVPVAGTEVIKTENGQDVETPFSVLLAEKVFKVKYDVLEGEIEYKDLVTSAVILKDYTSQISETNIPRAQINDPIVELEASMFAYANTAAMNSTGVFGMRINNESEQPNVDSMNEVTEEAALTGKRAIGIVSPIDKDPLTTGNTGTAEDFMVLAQAIDNERLSLYGIANGGLYQKKAYVNDSQTAMNVGQPDDVYHNGLMLRQKFCDVVNSIWRLGIACEAAEYHSGADLNGDGDTDNRTDQSGENPGDQPAGGGV